MVGESVGSFSIVSRLGRAGHGDLWRGERATDKLAVTIELLPAGATSFAATAIAHANLPRALDCGVSAAGRPYVVLASLAGESLAERLRESGPLTGAQVAFVAHQVANALGALHAAGVMHRCLSTAGLYLVGDQVIVLEAGLASARDAYTAPELWDAPATGDVRADIYALGCIAFELACGHPPFTGTQAELRERHLHMAAPIADLGAGVPATLGKLIARMLDKDPAQRPRVALDLARVMALLAGGESAPALGTTIGAHAAPTIVPKLGVTVSAKLEPSAVTYVPHRPTKPSDER